MTGTRFHVTGDADGRTSATLYRAAPGAPSTGLFVLAHGAGAGQSSPFMTSYAAAFAAHGLDVVTFDFPYMAGRRRAPDRAPVLEESFRRTIVEAARHPDVGSRRLFIGGKSMGGRIATHLAAANDQWPEAPPLAGVVVFGYPLMPPGGRGASDRVSHLQRIVVPTLIVQGTRDSFGGPDAFRAAVGNPAIEVRPVEGGDHSFAVPKSSARPQADVHREVLDAVVAWIRTRT